MPEELPSLDKQCFFIAPIGEEGSPSRDRSDGVLEFIVGRAAEELGLVAFRGDQIAQPGQITIQVLDHVLGARAAVADLTGQNPNVFYELAVRHTARLPTILICDKTESLPFDIAQMRTVMFDHTDLRSSDACRRAIVAQLREAFDGAVDSPIATTLDVRALQGGNTMERSIADLVTSVEELSKGQRDLSTIVRRRVLTDRPSYAAEAKALQDLIESAVGNGRFGPQELQGLVNDRTSPEFIKWLDRMTKLASEVQARRDALPTYDYGEEPF